MEDAAERNHPLPRCTDRTPAPEPDRILKAGDSHDLVDQHGSPIISYSRSDQVRPSVKQVSEPYRLASKLAIPDSLRTQILRQQSAYTDTISALRKLGGVSSFSWHFRPQSEVPSG